ncbi:ribonuclease III [Paludifilum halophilum]|uniref:Mini-ribonuclease 3 n=1 Tax=Paludifilum halophilum TaxID=1642702 RepID=A0A235B2Y6_9BACL|nr:ribonuclease III domain-containing protein [Paludifilum halophilum]OYD06611.1 ribonuclease III [Paludifilum halophilum]
MIQQPKSKAPGEINPLLLAYVGDAVYELYVRTHLVARGDVRPNEVHREAVRFVSAPFQAEAVRRITGLLTEEEQVVLRRGRNAKSGSIPKNAKASDYRYSTGLEALVGHWFLAGETDRLQEVMGKIISSLEAGDECGE